MTDTGDKSKKKDDVTTGFHKGLTSYGDSDFSLFPRNAFVRGAGFTDNALNRPAIGSANTGTAFNPCHGNMPQLIEAVRRGVMMAGGLPMDFPTISIFNMAAYYIQAAKKYVDACACKSNYSKTIKINDKKDWKN